MQCEKTRCMHGLHRLIKGYILKEDAIMILIQIGNEYMPKILFNSLINEETSRCCRETKNQLTGSHIFSQIWKAEMNL